MSPGYHRQVIRTGPRPDGGQRPHPHRSWLHLLPQDPDQPLPEGVERRAQEVLLATGMAQLGPDGGLLPGPEFRRALGGARGELPLAGVAPRGEVRVEAGVLRFYPDPGPQGFDTVPLHSYLAPCPRCGAELELFLLRFPHPDPHSTTCPGCQATLSLLELEFTPELPRARLEITFGDLDQRPSLRHHPVFPRLERDLGLALREVHVSL